MLNPLLQLPPSIFRLIAHASSLISSCVSTSSLAFEAKAVNVVAENYRSLGQCRGGERVSGLHRVSTVNAVAISYAFINFSPSQSRPGVRFEASGSELWLSSRNIAPILSIMNAVA
jgi:hypothetical protein